MKPFLAVVVPFFNEAAVVEELITRVDRALARTGQGYLIAAVDDGSSDATPQILGQLAASLDGRLLVMRPPRNLGQFGATCWGLERVQAEWLAVMDGDLQDPPELLTAMVAQLMGAEPNQQCLFAVKASREDPLWFRCARAVYMAALHIAGASVPPRGAGSYCAMRPDLAAKVVATALTHANLAPVLATHTRSWKTLPYHKHARYDGQSRVGPIGLCREALGSLAVSGGLRRMATAVALIAFGAAALPLLVSTSDAEDLPASQDELPTTEPAPFAQQPAGPAGPAGPATRGPRSDGAVKAIELSLPPTSPS